MKRSHTVIDYGAVVHASPLSKRKIKITEDQVDIDFLETLDEYERTKEKDLFFATYSIEGIYDLFNKIKLEQEKQNRILSRISNFSEGARKYSLSKKRKDAEISEVGFNQNR